MSGSKLIFPALVIFAILSLCACMNDSTGRSSKGGPGSNESISEGQVVRTTIVRDILGGALTTSIDPTAFSFEEITKRAMTINVEFSTKTSAIDEYFTFQGDDGADSLTIAASGNVEEIDTPDTGASLLKYSPLNLLFHFENFVFTNSCGVQSILTGDMECRVKGDYTRTNENFKGTATCTSGTYIETSDILYVLGDKEYKVRLAINVKVDGNAFNPDSYSFTGSFIIDSRIVGISSFADEQLTCEENSK